MQKTVDEYLNSVEGFDMKGELCDIYIEIEPSIQTILLLLNIKKSWDPFTYQNKYTNYLINYLNILFPLF